MVCRFYNFSFDKVLSMTMRTFNIFLHEMSVIIKMENGGEEKKNESLTGNAGFALAKTIFPKGKG